MKHAIYLNLIIPGLFSISFPLLVILMNNILGQTNPWNGLAYVIIITFCIPFILLFVNNIIHDRQLESSIFKSFAYMLTGLLSSTMIIYILARLGGTKLVISASQVKDAMKGISEVHLGFAVILMIILFMQKANRVKQSNIVLGISRVLVGMLAFLCIFNISNANSEKIIILSTIAFIILSVLSSFELFWKHFEKDVKQLES